MKPSAKFQKEQRVGVDNSPGSQQIYEVDEVAGSGSTWTYTFLGCTTKNPVFVTFSSGGYSPYQLGRSLAIFGLNSQGREKLPLSAFVSTKNQLKL